MALIFEALMVIIFAFYLVHFFGLYSRCRWWKVRWLNWKWTGDRTRGMRAWRPASVPALRTAAAPSPFSGRQCRCSPAGYRRFLRKCRGLSRPPHLPKRNENFENLNQSINQSTNQCNYRIFDQYFFNQSINQSIRQTNSSPNKLLFNQSINQSEEWSVNRLLEFNASCKSYQAREFVQSFRAISWRRESWT